MLDMNISFSAQVSGLAARSVSTSLALSFAKFPADKGALNGCQRF